MKRKLFLRWRAKGEDILREFYLIHYSLRAYIFPVLYQYNLKHDWRFFIYRLLEEHFELNVYLVQQTFHVKIKSAIGIWGNVCNCFPFALLRGNVRKK